MCLSESPLLPSHSQANTNITTTLIVSYWGTESYDFIWTSAENLIKLTIFPENQTDWCLAECDPQTDGRTDGGKNVILCNPDGSWEWLGYFLSGSSSAKLRLQFRPSSSVRSADCQVLIIQTDPALTLWHWDTFCLHERLYYLFVFIYILHFSQHNARLAGW